MAFSKTWEKGGTDSEKSNLVKGILSGKDETEGVDNPTEEALEGEWDGHLNVDEADNGIIVKHSRHIKRAPKQGGGKDTLAEPSSDYKEHARVFAKADRKGIAGHVLAIIHSPRKKR